MSVFCFVILIVEPKYNITGISQNPRIFFSFSLSFSFIQRFQQGHSAAFYRDHPQDIRHRTIQSRKPPPLSTHLMKGDPDSATSPSKYKQRPPTVLPPPDVTLTTPVTEIQRIRVIDSLREEDFGGLLLNLDAEVDSDKRRDIRRKINDVPSTNEAALRLALNRRAVRQDRNLSVADDDKEDRNMPKDNSEMTSKGLRKVASRSTLQSSKGVDKLGRKKTPMATGTMTTSDSDDEFVRPTRRKPRKKKRDKSDSGTEKSPTRRPKPSTYEEEDHAFEEQGKEDKGKVDAYVLTQWKLSQDKTQKINFQKRERAKSTSQAMESEDHSTEVGIQKLLHRSTTGFCIDDVRNALENARVIGKSDRDLDQISSDEGIRNLTGKALIDHKKKMAMKWQRMAAKIMKQETVIGDPDVDKALLTVKFSKLGRSIPEIDEANIAERTKHIVGSNKTDGTKVKTNKRKPGVPATPAKLERRGNDHSNENHSLKISRGSKNTLNNTSKKQKATKTVNETVPDSKIPKPNSPTRRQRVPSKPTKPDTNHEESIVSNSRLPSPVKNQRSITGPRAKQLSPIKGETKKQNETNSISSLGAQELPEKGTKSGWKKLRNALELGGAFSKQRQPSLNQREASPNKREASPNKRDLNSNNKDNFSSSKEPAESIRTKKSEKSKREFESTTELHVFQPSKGHKTTDPFDDTTTHNITKLPPLGEAMALPRTEETAVESSKRLELIKAARNARPIPLGHPTSNENDKNTTKKQTQKSGGRAYLPLTTKKPKKKMPGEEEADQQFYRVFKLVYVDLPVPEDDLPCE